MNKQRRSRLSKVCTKLEELKAEIEAVLDEEQEAFDNLPESFQYNDRGSAMEDSIASIDGVKDYIDDIVAGLNEAIEN